MSVTIKDIALRANVSHTTVSRALNGNSSISKSTRDQIIKLANEMGYVPNLAAKSLARVNSFNVGVVFSSIIKSNSADFTYEVIKNVQLILEDRFNMVLNGLDHFTKGLKISKQNFAGILLISQKDTDDEFIKLVKNSDVPIVVMNRNAKFKGIPSIYCDEKSGIVEAVNYLYAHGHTEIGYMQGLNTSHNNNRRFSGFEKGMKELGIPINEKYIFKADFSIQTAYEVMKDEIKKGDLPTAMICGSDAMAFGSMKAIAEAGFSIPNDISIIGFDNGTLANFSHPGITSIGRPIAEMTQSSVKELLKMIDDDGYIAKKEIVYNTKLAIKESVKPL